MMSTRSLSFSQDCGVLQAPKLLLLLHVLFSLVSLGAASAMAQLFWSVLTKKVLLNLYLSNTP